MLFTSFWFLVFYVIVFVVYYAIPFKYRHIWLLLCSYFFYLTWNVKYTLVLLAITLVTYLGALLAEKKRKWYIIAGSLLSSLCIFLFLKYTPFLFISINKCLDILHIQSPFMVSDWLVPVGLSFYTLQAVGYLIDVYRKKVKPERNLAKYALFVSFFPTILSGPIERSDNLLKQIAEEKHFSYENVKEGLLIAAYGYFEKCLVADRIAQMVDFAFSGYREQTGAVMAFAVILYAVQIYTDFSGYSHMAIGFSKALGFQLIENFRQPYFSLSIKDFWRRWHISLSQWLRDYIYIPLGGNRCSKLRKSINLFVTFLISGLWHGTGWHFIVWGGIHGSYQVVSQLTFGVRNKIQKLCKIKTNSLGCHLARGMMTFLMVDFAWLFFRAANVKEALEILRKIICEIGLREMLENRTYLLGRSSLGLFILAIEVLAVFIVDILRERGKSVISWLNKRNIIVRWVCYYVFVVILLTGIISEYGADALTFIYSKF